VAISHPLLHPEASTKMTLRYSQQYVDLIDLASNELKTLSVYDVLNPHYQPLRYMAQLDQGGYLTPLRSVPLGDNIHNLVLTFDELFRRTPLANRLKDMLNILEENYQSPVDVEFTAKIEDPLSLQPDIQISLLQCRPQSHLIETEARLPQKLKKEDIIFSTRRMAPQGRVSKIRYVLFVPPECYFALPTAVERAKLGNAIGKLNAILMDEVFICIGPGRWGTSNPDLGIKITYADIYNTRALVELAGKGIGAAPEASFGTHFFQDLVESNIYPLALYLGDSGAVFNRDFFYNTQNSLKKFGLNVHNLSDCLRLIDVTDFRPKHYLELVMDDDQGRSVAYLEHE
jgi:hypothetical protein